MSAKVLIIGALITLIVIISGAMLLTGNEKPAVTAKTYTSADNNRPKVETPSTSFDFGEIKVSDIKQNEFIVKNIGNKPLAISNITSSCGCTTGQTIYQGVKSKEYGMHNPANGVIVEIAPGNTAKINVIYRPYVMPVNGPVEREVYVSTNDPNNARIVFVVKAKVI